MRKMTGKYEELQATELGDQQVVMTNWWSHDSNVRSPVRTGGRVPNPLIMSVAIKSHHLRNQVEMVTSV